MWQSTAQVRPMMLCIYYYVLYLTKTWHIWLKGTYSNKGFVWNIISIRYSNCYHRNKNISILCCFPPVTIETRSFLSCCFRPVTIETKNHSYLLLGLLPTCYHRNKIILIRLLLTCYHRNKIILIRLLPTCYHRNKIILIRLLSTCYLRNKYQAVTHLLKSSL